MKCYICNQTPPTATPRYHIAEAIGICHHCGIGVCAEHSHKEIEPGSLLLCTQCASPGNGVSVAEPADASLKRRVIAHV